MKTKEFVKELNSKNLKQLNESLIKNRDKLHELRRDLSLGKLKNMTEINATRKQIARIMTVVNQKAEIMVEDSTKEPSDD